MATIYFLKDGRTAIGDRPMRKFSVPIATATQELKRYRRRRFTKLPTLNTDASAANLAPYRHVVLHVADHETNGTFSKPGYYYLKTLTPEQCQRLFGVFGPLS